MSDLEDRIVQGKVDPVYLLIGSDPWLYQRVLGALTTAIVTPATRAFNLDAFEGKSATAQAVLNAARTLPMMAKRRLVVVRDVDGLGADGLAHVAAYLEAPAPETTLVLSAPKADGRLKFYQIAKKRGYLHDLEVPRNLAGWIAEQAARRRAKVTPDAARRLAEVVGPDLGRLASSLEQLVLYCDGRPVEAADVDELVAETRERTVFELANAVGQGQRERALKAISSLIEQRESAVGVAMMLARHVRQVALVRELSEARTPRAELPRLAGVPPFALDGLIAQARRFSRPSLARAFELVARADLDLKGPVKAALGERIVLERLVEDLLSLGR
jgi:DNA polymerase III subunit delta